MYGLVKSFRFLQFVTEKIIKLSVSAQDHKTVYNHDLGPNTGGMGCVSNPQIVTPQIIKKVQKTILDPFMKGMKKEGRPYTGVLYLGAMVTKSRN
jgi:phosphoribosylamine-glycine ligase